MRVFKLNQLLPSDYIESIKKKIKLNQKGSKDHSQV